MVEIIIGGKEYVPDAFLPSREERKKLEREGNVFGRPEELRKEALKNKRFNELKNKQERLKYLKEAFYNIQNGKSYIKQRQKEVENARKNEEYVREQIERQRRNIMGKS